jgi:uncharacterized membrane-anchored protein
MPKTILWVTAVLIFLSVNYTIWGQEKLVASGRTVLLELVPVDPMSLMQGEYMSLRFKLESDSATSQDMKRFKDGRMVVAVDPQGIGTFRRFDNGEAVAADEMFLRYRSRNGQPKLATDAFFFQQRQAKQYSNAKYGEFKVSSDGRVLLTALRGPNLESLGPKVTK